MILPIPEILNGMQLYELKWVQGLQADILKLPNGYLLGTYDSATDSVKAYCFIPYSSEEGLK